MDTSSTRLEAGAHPFNLTQPHISPSPQSASTTSITPITSTSTQSACPPPPRPSLVHDTESSCGRVCRVCASPWPRQRASPPPPLWGNADCLPPLIKLFAISRRSVPLQKMFKIFVQLIRSCSQQIVCGNSKCSDILCRKHASNSLHFK